MDEGPMVWSGSEEHQRCVRVWASLQGRERSPDCHILSSAGKEASHEFHGVISACGGKEEKETARVRTSPARAQGASATGGLGPPGQESGVR